MTDLHITTESKRWQTARVHALTDRGLRWLAEAVTLYVAADHPAITVTDEGASELGITAHDAGLTVEDER